VNIRPRAHALAAPLLVAAMVVVPACGSGSHGDKAAATARTGILEIAAGSCSASSSTGSWFRMVQPGGTPEHGPYVDNGDSSCGDKTLTPLAPGTDGGLRVGGYQAEPNPPFADGGASRSDAVIKPATFFAVPFGMSTNPTDPQTRRKVPPPSLTIAGSTLRADLSALSVSWNGQFFNQGAPKPGASGRATGTFDSSTKRYTVEWTSAIKGGPFNGFTGVWHLEGTFRAT
jgi:hypothetical protein